MTELEQIFLTSGLTIIGGVIIFVAGQLINELWIKPYIKYKKIIGEIDEELIFSSDIYTNPGHIKDNKLKLKLYRIASRRLRRLASKFAACYRSLGLIKCLIKMKKVVNEENKDIIEGDLIFLSNSLFYENSLDHNLDKSEEIRTILKI